MFIPSVNEHCGHYFIVIACLVKPWFITHSIFLNRIVLASYALQVFLHTMIILCYYVSRDSCSYESRAYQILELRVSEFCSTLPNSHVKSRVCFGVLSRNSQRGRCKVEFFQPSCWFYSMPNLLVF